MSAYNTSRSLREPFVFSTLRGLAGDGDYTYASPLAALLDVVEAAAATTAILRDRLGEDFRSAVLDELDAALARFDFGDDA